MDVKCPRCGQLTRYSPENAFRPFCSERCKLIDLGEWAEGKYTIPVVDLSDIDDSALEGEEPGADEDASSDDLH